MILFKMCKQCVEDCFDVMVGEADFELNKAPSFLKSIQNRHETENNEHVEGDAVTRER